MKPRSEMMMLGVLLGAAGCTSTAYSGGTTAAPATTALKAYVGLFGDNAVAVIDTRANKVMKTIPVPTGPHGLVVTPDGAKVFVSSDGSSTISVIDTATDA